MAYTKWVLEYDNYGNGGFSEWLNVMSGDEYIAKVGESRELTDEHKANAELIVTAVNACIKLNPDNPHAVAERISDMYEAVKAIITTMQTEHTYQSFEATMKPIMLQAQEALAKTGRK